MPAAGRWRDASHRAVLRNDRLEAGFQSGLLYRLLDRVTGRAICSVDPATLPADQPLFGSAGIDLDACAVDGEVAPDSVASRFRAPDGTEWLLRWSIEPGAGDLVLRTSARAPAPVGEFRVSFPGCDIARQTLVAVNGCGCGQEFKAPWTGPFSDAAVEGFTFSPRHVHPLVALFQGEESGWFLEGRDPDIGPANLFARGHGQTAELVAMRGYTTATREPRMFEIRMRTYHGAWQDAVDPYVEWLEKGVGFVPIDRKPQAWVRNIRAQAYLDPGDFEGLEALARRLVPSKTFLGRVAGFRPYAFDTHFPNYAPSEVAAKWFQRARELGFHVGAHFNTTGVDPCYPELIERFRKGFMVIERDAEGHERFTDPPPLHAGRVTVAREGGKETYWGVLPSVVYSSTANKDWRDHFIQRIKPCVDAGVDVIYLDESMGPCGRFVVDGTTAIQGVMALEKEILETYPHVVIETEQINTMCARWSSFALTTLDLGHPLGGYIFHRFVKFVPESNFYQPVDGKHMDQFQRFGFLLPGASSEESWLQIARAFQDFDLEPAPRLLLKPYQLSGWRGPNGVTAYYEKHAKKRGLVVYAPGAEPRWFGRRVTGVRTWAGPGALGDWALYRGSTLLGLDPGQTYVFEETVKLPADRFHITEVPGDFALFTDMDQRIRPQYIGRNGAFYIITFTGSGEIAMHVPGDVLVFLDGEEVPVDRGARVACARIAAKTDKPSVLLAYPTVNTVLEGKWVHLPWQTPPQERHGFVVPQGDGFFNHLCGTAQIIGRLPRARSIRLRGAWGMSGRPKSVGDAVARINGREVLRVPPGEQPYRAREFDVDISRFAGRHVLLQFSVDGEVHGFSSTNWYTPRIVVERDSAAPAVGNPGPGNAWSSSDSVEVRASSSHPTYVVQRVVDGSGITPDGLKHDPANPHNMFVTAPLAASEANPRGGTVRGGHWIEFSFDRVHALGEMWMWNYDSYTESYDWRVQGFKDVTIQYSTTGGKDRGEWRTIYRGRIPMAPAVAGTPASLIVDFDGARAAYVVVTTADAPEHNWSNGSRTDAALSEVRFYRMPPSGNGKD